MTHQVELSDGVVTIRTPLPGDAELLIAGRDAEWERWLGPGEESPRPTACIVLDGAVIGWVDYDTGPKWLGRREANVGYNVFAPYRGHGYATRALKLLVRHIAEETDVERAYLAIDAENVASLGVARAVGAGVVEHYLNEEGRPNIRHVLHVTR